MMRMAEGEGLWQPGSQQGRHPCTFHARAESVLTVTFLAVLNLRLLRSQIQTPVLLVPRGLG